MRTVATPQGIYRDRMIRSDATMRQWGWRSNIIVERCRFLLAGFMKRENVRGISALYVGRGLESWGSNPPSPDVSNNSLVDPDPFRITIAPDRISFLNAAGNIEEGPTNRIEVNVVMGEDTPPPEGDSGAYPLREFGLFGRFGTEEFMIDYVRHPVIYKAGHDTLERTIRFVF